MTVRAAFLDKDGTLVENVPYNIDPRLVRFTPGAVDALRTLKDAGYALIVATNQSGVARGYYSVAQLEHIGEVVTTKLAEEGIELAGYYVCPHHPAGAMPAYAIDCACRKPKPGMLLRAARELDLDLENSWMFGDILDDIEAGRRAGCRGALIDTGGETEWKPGALRVPHVVGNDLLEAARSVLAYEQRSTIEAVAT